MSGAITGAGAGGSAQRADVYTRVEGEVSQARMKAVTTAVDDLVKRGEVKFSKPMATEKGVHVQVTYDGKTTSVELPGKPDGKVDANTLKAGLARRLVHSVGDQNHNLPNLGKLLNKVSSMTGISEGYRAQIETQVQRQLAPKPAVAAPPAAPAANGKVAASVARVAGGATGLKAFAPIQLASQLLSAVNDEKDAKDPKVVSAIVDAMEAGDQGVLMAMKMKWPSNPLVKAVREEIRNRQEMA